MKEQVKFLGCWVDLLKIESKSVVVKSAHCCAPWTVEKKRIEAWRLV